MKKWPFIVLAATALYLTVRPLLSNAQPLRYTVANTHSHNDYEQATPFWLAWQAQFGSIEADIFWLNGQMLVGHSLEEIKSGRTLEEYYLKPLLSCLQKNNGHPYADTARQLQLLIDVKTDKNYYVKLKV